MPIDMKLKFDVIGYWSEIKEGIIQKYASAYSRLLTARKFHHVYIDAFAGAGKHISKSTGVFVRGSPQIALDTKPPFSEYYFIDIERAKIEELNKLVAQHPEAHVHVYEGDCNSILLTDVFPKVKYDDFRKGLCLLDPYGLHLQWEVIRTAGQMRSIDMFLNFPVADMNRNVLWRNVEGVDPADISRMDAFWGDNSWQEVAYRPTRNLFGEVWDIKEQNRTIALGFKERLEKIAGFKHVSEPLPMRNSKGTPIYYLFLASQSEVAKKIISDIFNKYRDWGVK